MDSDIRILKVEPEFTEECFRTPLKFGSGMIKTITSCKVKVLAENRKGSVSEGVGNMLLSYIWAFPSLVVPNETRDAVMRELCRKYCLMYEDLNNYQHPVDIYFDVKDEIKRKLHDVKEQFSLQEEIPVLAGLVCNSPIDAAIHDAFGKVNGICTYEGYGPNHMENDLSHYLGSDFKGAYIADFVRKSPVKSLPVFHLVGGLDKLTKTEIDGSDPADGYPVSLDQWIERDGVFCFKVKLKGKDILWDVERTIDVAGVASENLAKHGVKQFFLSTDSNEMNENPESVVEYLMRLRERSSRTFDSLLYVEQPIERDMEKNLYDMHKVCGLKPALADEGITDVESFRTAVKLGWSGIALKVCKGHTAALMYASMAEKYNLKYSVQDLTNPGISFLHSAGFAARINPVMGVEYNARQYVPEAQPQIRSKYPGVFGVSKGCIRFDPVDVNGLGIS